LFSIAIDHCKYRSARKSKARQRRKEFLDKGTFPRERSDPSAGISFKKIDFSR